jgi:hypothetical protein
LDEYVFVESGDEKDESEDGIWCYGVNIGVSKVVEAFEGQVGMFKKSSAHSHRSSSDRH